MPFRATTPPPPPPISLPVFTARGVAKVYTMGEVRVDALRGVDFDLTA